MIVENEKEIKKSQQNNNSNKKICVFLRFSNKNGKIYIKNGNQNCSVARSLEIAQAQSLDNFGSRQPLSITGFVSTNQILNIDGKGKENYSGYYVGSLNFSIYEFAVPLTFIYSNNQKSFTHPFNQFALHPSYKWLKTHIGYASMSFTPYTLSGRLFLGAGVEITPEEKPFYAKMMYGRFQKATEYDSLNVSQTAAYQRMGYGAQFGFGKNENFIDINLFRASDDKNSINTADFAGEHYVPSVDNSVMSVSFSKKLFENFIIQGEFANSFLTTDKTAETIRSKNEILKPPLWFMQERSTTISRRAMKANAAYRKNSYSAGVGYERIDPEFQTLGAYYFTNNMENITINLSAGFFENKLNFSANAGLQKDNLDKNSMNNTVRWVGSGNVGFTPNDKLNLNVSYSNFTSYTNVKSTFDYINEINPYNNLDTLNYRQISQNTNFSGSYRFGNSEKAQQSANLNLTWQTSKDKQSESAQNSNFYNAGITYLCNYVPADINFSGGINLNRNEVTETNSYAYGPIFSVSKSFFEKTLRSSFSTSYNVSETGNYPASHIFNIRLGLAYLLKKQHNFNLSALYQWRDGANAASSIYNLALSYAYNFNLVNIKAKNKSTP